MFLMKPLSFLAVLFGAYVLKRVGVLHREDGAAVSRLVMTLTLPAAVVQSFAGFSGDASLLLIIVLGFLCSFALVLPTYAVTRGMEKHRRAFYMLNLSGFNIGCFSLPVIQSLLGASAGVVACLFDMGNAIMVTGGLYTLTSTLLKLDGERQTPRAVARKLFSSVPFDAYIVLLIMALCGIGVPEWFVTFTQPLANANAFLAMTMLGLMFEPPAKPEYVRQAAKLLSVRFVFAACVSALLYFFAPFDASVRAPLAIVAFAPLSALAPLYTERCGGDESLASFANSVSIFVSLAAAIGLSVLLM